MSVFRYVVANLVAGILRPVVWAALLVLAMWFVITVPARLWVLYVDPRPSAQTITLLEWGTGVILVGGWLFLKLFPSLRDTMRRQRISRGGVRRRA